MTIAASDRPFSRSRYTARHRSPGALVAAIALNGGVIALLLTLHANGIIIPSTSPLKVREFPIDPVPPPVDPVTTEKPKPLQRPVTQKAQDEKPFVRDSLFTEAGGAVVGGKTDPGPVDLRGLGDTLPPLDPPVHNPVLVGATPDPRYADAFHPAYPAALQRAGLEGSVTVRVTIDERGRVIDVAMVRATNAAFYEETREQALAHWRFRPATRDGVAVRSEQVLTVHFQLNA